MVTVPLNCGGHVTPPVGPGPVYHYHKAADCQNISSPGTHAPLIGYANDGFGIYGFGAFNGDPGKYTRNLPLLVVPMHGVCHCVCTDRLLVIPVLDECHGNFGPVPGPNCLHGTESTCAVAYKYHASPVFNLPGEPHKPVSHACSLHITSNDLSLPPLFLFLSLV